LHWAVKLRSLKVVSELLQHKKTTVIVNAADLTRSTALHYAAYYGIPEVITKLLEAGADVRLKDTDDLTAYDLVCGGMTSSHVTTAILLHPFYSNPAADGESVEEADFPPSTPAREHPLLRAVSNNLITQFQMAKTVVVDKASTKTLKPGKSKKQQATSSTAMPLQRSSSAPSVRLSNEEQSMLAHKLSYTWKKDTVDPNIRTVDLGGGVEVEAPLYELPFQPLNATFDVSGIVSKLPYPNGAMGASNHTQARKDKAVVVVSVEQCHDCAAHGWNLRHNEEQYKQQADDALMQCVCTLLNANDIPLSVFAFKHRAPKSRTGALEVVVSILVPDSSHSKEVLKKTYKPGKRPATATKPDTHSPPRRQPLSSDRAGKPVFKNSSYTNGAVLPTPAPPVLHDADKQALFNRQRRTRQGLVWVHHVLHSKLAAQTWPVLDTVAHELLRVVRAFVPGTSASGSARPLSGVFSGTGPSGDDEDIQSLPPAQRALSIAKLRSPTFVMNGRHADNVFYYNMWHERIFPTPEREPSPVAAPLSTLKSAPVSAPKPVSVVSSPSPSRAPSSQNLLALKSVAVTPLCSPIVSARGDRGEASSMNGSVELVNDSVPETAPEPSELSDAAKLMALASHSVSPVKKNKKQAKACLPCFLDYVPRPQEDREFHKESKQRQKIAITEYEDLVLNHFFVFDNNV